MVLKVSRVGMESRLTVSIPAEISRLCRSMARSEMEWAFVSQVIALEGGRWGMVTDMASRMRSYMAVDGPGVAPYDSWSCWSLSASSVWVSGSVASSVVVVVVVVAV